jgi:uncharacterized repeat protein (TIGR03803 family)
MAGLGLIPAGRVTAQTFTNLYSFTAAAYDSSIEANTNSDGGYPVAGLILSGNILYGTVSSGGTNGNGTVFAVNTDGTGFTNLHTFTALSAPFNGTNSDGANPFAGLVLSGNTLYGTTHSGGTYGGGTVFAVTTDGMVFTNLHTFTGGSDGDNPYAGLMVSGNTLFGTAGNGGNSFAGTLFAVTTNGMGFTTLHTFTNNPDGDSPHAVLLLSGNTLYGTTSGGGTNGSGLVFSFSLPTPQLTISISGANAIVTWPTNALEFTLQSTTNLDPAWSPVSLSPVIINGQNVVTNPFSGAPQQFFRLGL